MASAAYPAVNDPLQDRALGSEIAAAPVGCLIGGVLSTVIAAQAQASITTIDFIQSVGFKPSSSGNKSHCGEPIMVHFRYTQPVQALGALGASQKRVCSVPLLSMIPVPTLRISALTVAFNVRLTQTRETALEAQSMSFGMGTTSGGQGGQDSEDVTTGAGTTGWSWSAGSQPGGWSLSWNRTGFRDGYHANTSWNTSSTMTGIIASTTTNNSGMKVNREHTLRVEVSAVEDATPPGLEHIISILSGLIGPKPQPNPPALAASQAVTA